MTRLVYFCLIAVLTAAPSYAKPNFSGQWKLNVAKSDYGRLPPPTQLLRTVKHEDPKIYVSTTQTSQRGESTASFTYTTDGRESINKTKNGDIKVVAKWDGDILVVESSREIQGNEVKETNRWNLAEDGKSMTVVISLKSPNGETRMILFLEKQ